MLGGFFIANALIAEFIGVKIFSLEGTLGLNPIDINLFGSSFSFNLTAGVLLWPVVFIMTDIINEYYGQKGVKFLSYLTAVLISFAFLMFFWAIRLEPAGWWPGSKVNAGVPDMQVAYRAVFGQGLWIIIGSLTAFLIGQILDVLVFHKIKQKPGKPILFGVKDHKLVFGLPGNPASVLTCYYQYVLPAFSMLAGNNLNLPVKNVPLKTAFKKPEGLTHFLKGYFDGEGVELLGGQESYKLNSFAKANCLVEFAEDNTGLQDGDWVNIHLFAKVT